MGASVAVDAAEAPAKGPGSAAGCKLALSSSPCGAWIIVVSGYVPNKSGNPSKVRINPRMVATSLGLDLGELLDANQPYHDIGAGSRLQDDTYLRYRPPCPAASPTTVKKTTVKKTTIKKTTVKKTPGGGALCEEAQHYHVARERGRGQGIGVGGGGRERGQESATSRGGSPKPETRNTKHETRNTKPETRNTKHETRNPTPETRNTKSGARA
ncbi:hypothetical protein T484DRAFT_1907917 [Baffinella frigidus]|nr:hypothetical protein T484DRAFT_1907917 [Cryptophyta sp. CCMP2293]